MGHRILIVDDHTDTLELMRDIFSEEGHQVAALTSVRADLAEIHAAKPDLAIIDLRLSANAGDLSGWDLVRLIKADDALRRTRLLVVSADANGLRERVDEAARMDGVQLLAKPFSLDALLAMAADALGDRDPPSSPRFHEPPAQPQSSRPA